MEDAILNTACFPSQPLEQIKEEMQAARGQLPGDLLIKNINLVDVYCERIFPAALLIKNGKIVSIDPRETWTAARVFDGEGLLASPGFIEPHYHIDTTLVTPDTLAAGIVPAGTTTVCSEILDFTHHEWSLDGEEAAVEAVWVFLKGHRALPYRLLPLAPAKMVPTAITARFLNLPGFFALGEMLPGFILGMDDAYLSFLAQARALHKWTTGHIIGFAWVKEGDQYVPKNISKEEINPFALAGFTSDHEAWEYESAFQLLQHGVKPLVRGMSDQYKEIVGGMLRNQLPVDNLLFCFDDITFDTILNCGHINRMVSESIKLGLDPIKAIQVATLNTAREIGLEHRLGSLTPGKLADLFLFEDFNDIQPRYVFKGGELVAQHGRLVSECRLDYAPLRRSLPAYYQGLSLDDLRYPADAGALDGGQTAKARLMDIFAFHVNEVDMPVQNGQVLPLPGEDKLKLVLAARDESRALIKAFVQGFALKDGALAVSFTQNKHRIIAVGAADRDILTAIQTVDRYAGAVALVRNGQPVEVLPLEVSGMMSDLPFDEVKTRFEAITGALREMGCTLTEPLLLLWTCGFMFRFQ